MSRLDMLVRACESAITEFKAFLHRQRWKEALIFSCFVFLAFCFWMLQSLHQDYETKLSVPIKYINTPADVMFESAMPETLNVQVQDKGSALLNYTLGRKLRSITIDLSKLPTAEQKYMISTQVLEAEVQKQLLATTTLSKFEPRVIVLHYGQRKNKEVPVVFNGSIQPQKGFLVSDDIRISPSHVTVYASESILDSIYEVKTSFITIQNAKKTLTKHTSLEPIKGGNLNIESVSIVIPIEEYTEKTLEIPIQITQVPSKYTVRTFPQKVAVSCNIPVSKFNELESNLLKIEIPYKKLEETISGSLPVELTSQPKWVRSYHITPDKIEFLVEQNGL